MATIETAFPFLSNPPSLRGLVNATVQQHPGEDELSAYLDGGLGESDRARIEEHLAVCDDCREDVVEVSRLFQPRPNRRTWYVAAGLAAAALAGILLFTPLIRDSGPAGPVLRGPTMEAPAGASSVQVVEPRDGSTLPATEVRFTWQAAASGASYRLTLTDQTGDVVWSLSTADTAASLPPDAALGRDQMYFWYVDALLPDGASTTSGVHGFKTAR
jgi:hypothetical protein